MNEKNIAEQLNALEKSIKAIEKKIDLIDLNSPVIRSREKAAKFLQIGRPKLKILLMRKDIREFWDIGGTYYLKSDLLKYLESRPKTYDKLSIDEFRKKTQVAK